MSPDLQRISDLWSKFKPYVVREIESRLAVRANRGGLDCASYSEGTWTPTFTGFSANPVGIYRYVRVGTLCTVFVLMTADGTSNQTYFTMTLPFVARTITSMIWVSSSGAYIDAGSGGILPPYLYVGSGSNILSLFTDLAGAGWGNSGTKSARFVFAFEIAP